MRLVYDNRVALLGLYLTCINAACFADPWSSDGNIKYQLLYTAFPADSVLRGGDDQNGLDNTLSTRLNLSFNTKPWLAEVSYQMAGFYADSLMRLDRFSGTLFSQGELLNDDTRLVDLTSVISRQGKRALLHRIDRLYLGYQNADNVIKIGRQAVSWGNGLAYTPMDFFNPFDPAAIDTEYKPGDDMLYAQHLFAGGNDLQLVWVGRRDGQKSANRRVSSTALKLHAFVNEFELDLLLAEHFQDTIVGIGGVASLGGAIARGDWVITDTPDKDFHSLVANLSYSWTAWGKNVTGFVEYFYNGFGIADGDYRLDNLLTRQQLLARITRGELFTLGKEYLAASATIEMAPLWTLTPNLFYNASDGSALGQVVSHHNLSQETRLIAAISVPLGSAATEFGGIPVDTGRTGQQARNLSTSWSLFAQLAWYF